MRVLRRGAARDDGQTEIEIKADKLRWNESAECITMSCDKPIRNFTGSSRHKYRVHHSVDEIAGYIKFLGDNCREMDKDEFIEKFSPIIPSLNRIIARASGIF